MNRSLPLIRTSLRVLSLTATLLLCPFGRAQQPDVPLNPPAGWHGFTAKSGNGSANILYITKEDFKETKQYSSAIIVSMVPDAGDVDPKRPTLSAQDLIQAFTLQKKGKGELLGEGKSDDSSYVTMVTTNASGSVQQSKTYYHADGPSVLSITFECPKAEWNENESLWQKFLQPFLKVWVKKPENGKN
jgi:hypothetical protein